MNTITINQNRNLATVLHLSVFTKYFIPMGNFIFPLLLWMIRKNDPFVDQHGRSAINFQISMFLYTIFIVCLGVAAMIFFGLRLSLEELRMLDEPSIQLTEIGQAVPFIIILSILGTILLALFILEIFTVISASLKASEGKPYQYPLTINFLGEPEATEETETEKEE